MFQPRKPSAEKDHKPLPLAETAVLGPRVDSHIAIAFDGAIQLVFPRGVVPFVEIQRMAKRIPGSEIRLIKVRTTYQVLEDNCYYDTSASV